MKCCLWEAEVSEITRMFGCKITFYFSCMYNIYMLFMYIYLYLYFMWPTGGGNGEVQRSATPQMRRDGLRTLRAYRFLAATHIELMTGHGGSWCLQVLHKSLSSAVLVTSVELQSKKGTTDIARTPCYNDMQVTSVKFFSKPLSLTYLVFRYVSLSII